MKRRPTRHAGKAESQWIGTRPHHRQIRDARRPGDTAVITLGSVSRKLSGRPISFAEFCSPDPVSAHRLLRLTIAHGSRAGDVAEANFSDAGRVKVRIAKTERPQRTCVVRSRLP
jgi:hypothetical protein